MRGLLLMAAAAIIMTLGLGCRSNRYDQAYYNQGSQRTNLYPLTSPPPGSVQPVRGYGPTTVSSTRDYYGQGNYAGYNTGYYGTTQTASYANPGYYGATTTTASYAPTPTTGYGTASYGTGYGTGYTASQDPFPPGTVGASGSNNMVTNPFSPGGGYCRVEDVTPYMNPTVPIKDPPVMIGNNINLGNTATGYTTGYAAPQQPYVSQAGYGTTTTAAGYTTGATNYAAGYTAGYATAGYGATRPASLSAVASTGGNINYDAGPVPYCGPGVACPPDPRVDTSMYGTSSSLPSGTQVQTVLGEAVGTADLVQGGGYTTTATYGATQYGAPMVGAGYTGGVDTYRGGAYPRAIDTIPATYRTGSAPVGIDTGMSAGSIRLVPALDVPPGRHSGDAAPSQWFEIVRPGNAAMRIGRVSATCVCVGVRVPKRQIAAGERALIEARILSRPPANNLTYGIFVNVVEPQQIVLDADVTISM